MITEGKECVSGWIFTEILSHSRFKWFRWWDWGFLNCWDWLLYGLNYLGMLEWDESILMCGGMNFREPKGRTVVCRITDPQRYICFNHQTYETCKLLLLIILLTPNICCFSTTITNSLTLQRPTWCPTIQTNSDTNHLGLHQTHKFQGSVS